MTTNPNFWRDYPIYLNSMTLLNDREKDALKQ